jgi:hypothetical protein
MEHPGNLGAVAPGPWLGAAALAALAALALGCQDTPAPDTADPAAAAAQKGEDNPLLAKERIVLVDFDGSAAPRNGDGNTYPNQYAGSGKATLSLDTDDAVAGSSLNVRLASGRLNLEFNPYNYAGNKAFPAGPRAFAHDYTRTPAAWKFNTYNRLRFWLKAPTNGPPHFTTGQHNMEFGTYVKRVAKPDRASDEAGGGHYYHLLNIPALGEWTQVVLNMHPDHQRGTPGGADPGVLAHPTNEDKYNYFDALTRFYFEYPYAAPKNYPADFRLDEVEFFQQPKEENDAEVYSLSATYVSATNRLLLIWNRKKSETKTRHEIRYAFADIHASGWKAAKPAPNGLVTPPSDGAYNNMVYDTTALELGKQGLLYLAIKPENSEHFSQIIVPLGKR